MMGRQEVLENLWQERQKLNKVIRENKRLKQLLSDKQATATEHVMKLKSAADDKRFVQEFLHSYIGAKVKKKDDTLEVYFEPSCTGASQGKYVMVLQSLTENSWKVVGYNLPLSVTERQGTEVESALELGELIRAVRNEVQAYTERKDQVTRTEEIFKKVDASLWYTTKLQTVYLTLPMKIGESGKKSVCKVELTYEVADILPFKVSTNVEEMDAAKMDKLSKRISNLFQHFSLFTIMKEEFDESKEETAMSSILGSLSP